MTSDRAADLDFDPDAPEHRADPYPLLRRMRETAPVYQRPHAPGTPATWYLTRYADVQKALADPRLVRQAERLPKELAAPYRRRLDPLSALRHNVFNLDPPDHTRLRRLLTPAFGARSIAALRRRVADVVAGLVDAADGAGEIDVIAQLALPLPVVVVAELIGFPPEDVVPLREWSDAMLRGSDPVRVHRAGLAFAAHVERRCAESRLRASRGEVGEDLFSWLVKAESAGEISRAELVSSVFQLLLAGDETTVYLVGNAVLELLRHPDQLARLRARPELIDSAIEEVARFNGSVGHGRGVYVLEDVEFGGVPIPRGDTVIPVLAAANRDPEVFPDPDRFDIGRGPNRHLGFGHGPHFCLGAALARLQARTAVDALFRRFPALRLAVEPEALRWTPGLFLHGVDALPVALNQQDAVPRCSARNRSTAA